MKSEPMVVACAADQHYALPLEVMLTSLRAHLPASQEVEVYCLTTDLQADCRARLERCLPIHWLDWAGAEVGGRYPALAMAPLLFADLLPQHIQRALFLDTDLLILNSVLPLWQQDMGDHILAAAPDLAIPFVSSARGVSKWRELGLPAGAPYFNAGVMLMDVPAWRSQGISASVHRYLAENDCDFLHQEALNALLCQHWQPLHPRWNMIAGLAGRPYYRPISPFWGEAMCHPGIVHFAGALKPWRGALGGPFGPAYQACLHRLAARHSRLDWRAGLVHCYDGYLRNGLYRLERFLWEGKLI